MTRVSLGVAAAVVLLDQWTKYLAVKHLEGQPPQELLGELLRLHFIRNPGAAFGLGPGYTAIITLIAVTIVVVIVRTARNLGSAMWAVCLGGMLGGALGNLLDRFFRSPGILRGHVVDFLELPHWPIFNVADMAVVGAAIGMVVLSIMGFDLDGSRSGKGGASRPEPEPGNNEPGNNEPGSSPPGSTEGV